MTTPPRKNWPRTSLFFVDHVKILGLRRQKWLDVRVKTKQCAGHAPPNETKSDDCWISKICNLTDVDFRKNKSSLFVSLGGGLLCFFFYLLQKFVFHGITNDASDRGTCQRYVNIRPLRLIRPIFTIIIQTEKRYIELFICPASTHNSSTFYIHTHIQ